MANTFKKIQTVTVGSGGSATIEFTNIPQTYTDLKIVVSARGTNENFILAEFNGVTTGYSTRFVRGNGSTAASSTSSNLRVGVLNPSSYTASVFSTQEVYIPNYTSANQKSVSIDSVNENNATSNYMFLAAGLSTNTAAITSILLKNDGGENFVQYTTATLYGVSNASLVAGEAYATGGQQVYADATYWYHVFTSDGTFTPTRSLNVDYLVVAGGASGGNTEDFGSNGAGGGGAGGVRCTVGATGGGGSLESQLALTTQAYTVTIGAGGAAQSTHSAGNNGNNSVFASITSTGGGQGFGGSTLTSLSTGGSGGGGGEGPQGTCTPGLGTANQGYAGGTLGPSGTGGPGGGGGAGAVGVNGPTSTGGAGITTSISGTSTTYAGGGGGGTGAGGSGGGGAGGAQTGTAGTVNRGAGGGGAGPTDNATSGAGGSGIVIVRYAK